MKPWLLCVSFLSVGVAFAQKPAFEVASIKATDPQPMGKMMIGMSSDAGMVRYTNVSLKDCIRTAYRVKDFQVQGPEWIDSARFDISAKLPAGASENQVPEMLQTLLAERFKLTVRHDNKDQAVYALTVGKGGAKLKPAEVKKDDSAPKALGPDGKPRQMMMMQFQPGGAHLLAQSASLAGLADLVSRFTEKPVVDMTGIDGQYDFDLTFAPETMRGPGGPMGPGPMGPGGPGGPGGPPMTKNPADNPSEPAPSIFDAVQKFGLKLDARKAPMDFLIVTHIEKTPTEN
jgi:uncharacterized protein (TIGR03435 family)